MQAAVVMPKLGLIMTEGKIAQWLKSTGDIVNAGEPLLVVESDKLSAEVEAPDSGVVSSIVFPDGSTVEVGRVIGTIDVDGGAQAGVPAMDSASQQATPVTAAADAGTEPASANNPKATPVARRIAKTHGIDLVSVRGSGPGGAITERDVRASLESAQAAPPREDGLVALPTVRKVAAQRLSESYRTTPHFYLGVETDMSSFLLLRDGLVASAEKRSRPRPSITDLMLWFVTHCLRTHPVVNASWVGEGVIKLHRQVNIALAVATERGLVAPVLRDTDLGDFDRLVSRRQDLVDRSRSGRLQPDDLQDATFTLTNLGPCGVDTFQPIINPPQAAILAVGLVKERVIARAGQPAVRPTAHLTLAADHRVLDGAMGAAFLAGLVDLIEHPFGAVELRC